MASIIQMETKAITAVMPEERRIAAAASAVPVIQVQDVHSTTIWAKPRCMLCAALI